MSHLPIGWVRATVGEIAELTDGPFGSNLKTAHYTEAGPRVVRLQNIGDGTFRDEHAHIADEHYERLVKHAVRERDIVAASLGESVPRACLIPPWLGPAVVKADCIRIRAVGGLDSAFLMWMLNSPPVRGQAAASIKGVGRPRLGLGGMKKLVVPVPPVAEQRRVVAAIEEQFSRLDAAEVALMRASRRVRVLRRACFSLAVSEGDERPLGDLLDDIEAGKSFKCEARAADLHEWGVVRVSAMTWGSFDESQNKAVLDLERVDPRWEIRPGDLLLSRANTAEYVGATVLVRECRKRLLLSDKSMRLHVRPCIEKPWLQLALSAPETRSQMSAVATGTSDSMRNISQEKVKNVLLRVPPVEDQRTIVAEIEQRLSLVDALAAAIARATQGSAGLRRSVLERASTGALVPQDPADEPASELFERIASEQATSAIARRRPKVPA